MSRLASIVAPYLILFAVIAVAAGRGEAHRPMASPYTYNDDVFPILRARCGPCHVPGGVAPMSLMTFKDAFPAAESIQRELVGGHMPPWGVDDAAGRFRNALALKARELNILLTWAAGGNPLGNAERTPPQVEQQRVWRLGQPDLVVQMPTEFTVAADTDEATQEFALPTAAFRTHALRAIDVMPGNAAIVRSATVRVKDSPAEGTPESLLAMWVPGDVPVALDDGTAFRLPPGAELVLRVRYLKTWRFARTAVTDRTSVGLYFATAPAREVRALALTPGPSAETNVERRVSFSRVVDEDLQVLAIYPDTALERWNVDVRALRPDGSQAELIRLRPRHAEWARRYWFAKPVALPRGSRIDVVATARDALLASGDASSVATLVDSSSFRVTLDVVPTR